MIIVSLNTFTIMFHPVQFEGLIAIVLALSIPIVTIVMVFVAVIKKSKHQKDVRKMIIENTNAFFGYLERTGIRYQCKIKHSPYCQTGLFDHIPAGIETIHVTFVDAAGIFSAAVIHLDVPHIRTQFFSASVVINGSFQTAETNEIKNKQ